MIHLHRTPHLAFRISRAALYPLLATACLHVLSGAAAAQELSTPAFTLRYDESGIRSLKRTKDVQLSRIEFTLENRAGAAHRTELRLSGLPAGAYTVIVDGHPAGTILGSDHEQAFALAVDLSPTLPVTIVRRALPPRGIGHITAPPTSARCPNSGRARR